MGLSWAWLGILAAGNPAVSSRAQTVSGAPGRGAANDFQVGIKDRNCAEIEAETVSRAPEIEGNRVTHDVARAAIVIWMRERPEIFAETDQSKAIDGFLDFMSDLWAGREIRFAKLFSAYAAMRNVGGCVWPPVSTVAMSRRLRARGAARIQRRLSSADKPIFYILPDLIEGSSRECVAVREAA